MSLIQMTQINKSYGKEGYETYALWDASLKIEEGEMVAIMGPSGSGKSTLLNLLGCLDRPTAGEYLLDGEDTSTLSKNQLAELRNYKIGFVFQNFALLPEFSALENVELPLTYRKLSIRESRKRALRALQSVGLSDHIRKRPGQLSGGQQQRVAIARALVGETPIILADEPTGALDQQTGREIMEIFKSINESGKTVIIVTHDPVVASFCERKIHLQDGQILESQAESETNQLFGISD